MTAKDCCWNNAVVECFLSTIKDELGLDDETEILNGSEELIKQFALCIDRFYTASVVTQSSVASARSTTSTVNQHRYTQTRGALRPVHRIGQNHNED
jgi:hypothetical protein